MRENEMKAQVPSAETLLSKLEELGISRGAQITNRHDVLLRMQQGLER